MMICKTTLGCLILVTVMMIIDAMPLRSDELLSGSITSMSTLEIILKKLLPNYEMREVAERISSLYEVKSKIDNMDNATTEVEVVRKLLDTALNQSCEWLTNSLEGELENFSCSSEEMSWLNIKFRAAATIENAKTALKQKTTNTYFNICDWVKENIFCTDDVQYEPVRTFMQDEKILAYCRPQSC